jgi:hypothetical protein
MNTCCPRPRGTPLRRGAKITGFLLSGATLVLMPKCPLCLAAWVTLATGIGLSAASATCLRAGLLLVCTATLLGLGLSALRDIRRPG